MAKKPHYCGSFTRELPCSDFVSITSLSCTALPISSTGGVLCNCCFFAALHKPRQGLAAQAGPWAQQWQDSSDTTPPCTAGQRQDVYSSTDTITIHGIITSGDSLYQHQDRLGALWTQTLLPQNVVKEFSLLINTQNTKGIKPCTPAMGTISKLIKIIRKNHCVRRIHTGSHCSDTPLHPL